MAFDYTNFLEVDATIESDFEFRNRAGSQDSGLSARNSAGEWCLETTGSTTSSNTGATANPTGRSAYVYTETSTPAVSDTWQMTRKSSRNGNTDNLFYEYLYNSNCASDMTMHFEYATVANPNDTTDWTIVKSHVGNSNDAWVQESVDLSAVASDTVWVRFHADMASQYTHDFCLSTFREYSTDKNTVIGSTTDDDTSVNEVNESAPNGSVVGITALAMDVDIGDTVSYSLTDNAGGRFAIHATTGVVSVLDASLLVYANNISHDITMRATSSDTSFTELIATINVLADTPTSISQVIDSDASVNEVNESAPNGYTVGVTAYATDINYADSVSYSLDDNAGGRFTIHATTGVVTVLDSSLLVYANDTSHDITMRATSSDTSFTTLSLTIAVQETIKPNLNTSSKFTTIIASKVTFDATGLGEGLIINSEVHIINESQDLANNTINGDLHFNIGSDAVLTFTNVNVTGLIYNDDSAHLLTINTLNGTIAVAGDAGSGVGETNVASSVSININVKDQLGSPIVGALVYVDEDLETAGEIVNTTTDGNGDVVTVYSGVATSATIRVRKYGYKANVGSISLANDSNINVVLVTDPQQT